MKAKGLKFLSFLSFREKQRQMSKNMKRWEIT